MVTDQIFCEAHIENLKRDLGIDPQVVYGEEAKKLVKFYNHMADAGYVYDSGINTVALPNPSQLALAAHEMRHAWQFAYHQDRFSFTNKPKFKTKNIFKFVVNYIRYCYSAKEIDAERYAVSYCDKNRLPKSLRDAKVRYYIGKTSRWVIALAVPVEVGVFMLMKFFSQ